METLQKLEATMANWFKRAPHLPTDAQKWITQNAWWIVLIGVAISAFAILAALPLLLGASAFLSLFGPTYGSYAYSGLTLLNLWLSVAFIVGVLVLEGLAIKPLKSQQKRGWNLVFMATLLSALAAVVSAVVLMSVGKLVGGAISLLIGSYILFEVRGHFVAGRSIEARSKFVSAKK